MVGDNDGTHLDLDNLAKNIRKDVLDMTLHAGVNGGHLGGALSSADIIAALYGKVLNVFTEDPCNADRDRFILSKGHCSIVHYAALKEVGFLSEEDLETFESSESDYPTHEVLNIKKGIEISNGSLGYGLSIGVGSALACKRKGQNYRVFVLLGDGECNEGTVWEAAMAANKYGLNNLIAIVDINRQSLDGFTTETMPVFDMVSVWQGFGWSTLEVDGNDIEDFIKAFCKLSDKKPNVILAHTEKGKGISSIEGAVGWHHASLTEGQYKELLAELGVN